MSCTYSLIFCYQTATRHLVTAAVANAGLSPDSLVTADLSHPRTTVTPAVTVNVTPCLSNATVIYIKCIVEKYPFNALYFYPFILVPVLSL